MWRRVAQMCTVQHICRCKNLQQLTLCNHNCLAIKRSWIQILPGGGGFFRFLWSFPSVLLQLSVLSQVPQGGTSLTVGGTGSIRLRLGKKKEQRWNKDSQLQNFITNILLRYRDSNPRLLPPQIGNPDPVPGIGDLDVLRPETRFVLPQQKVVDRCRSSLSSSSIQRQPELERVADSTRKILAWKKACNKWAQYP